MFINLSLSVYTLAAQREGSAGKAERCVENGPQRHRPEGEPGPFHLRILLHCWHCQIVRSMHLQDLCIVIYYLTSATNVHLFRDIPL